MEMINPDSTSNKSSKKSAIFKELFSYLKIIVAALVIALVIDNFVIVNAQIPSGSMENGIKTGDRLVGFRFSYLAASPKRGDVVIFKFPDDESKNYIKRIIGLPGDTVEIKSGVLYINGEVYPEDYLKEPMVGSYGPYQVPDNSYFMLGDNRNHSADSRYWTNTYVSKNKILGKAIFKYYSSLKIIK